ncbi:MAG: hypothetical protein GDA46_01315 [Bdellovibrionales bacterium]|nr:hypothetical protein [Bdellovibrionales bacterium]
MKKNKLISVKENQSINPLIQLSDSYNRSTNLELDFKDSSKLENIYLSSKFQEALKEILISILEKDSNHRVRVLSGSPGLGKSTFALLTAYVVSKKKPEITVQLLRKSKKLKSDFQTFQKSKTTKLLPLFINGYEGEIESVFKNKLKESLAKKAVKIQIKDSLDFYKKALEILKTKNYSGIFVIYDEFGKYLEKGVHNPTDLNIQFLQNFAEFCNRSGEKQCHLMLITHLSVSQYANQLPLHIQQEWTKIEGRFQESAFYDKDADYYKMISSVFEKNISVTNPNLSKKYKSYINKYLSSFKCSAFEGFIDLTDIKSILLNCFPLHPTALALLPHLSKKVAQNERTLYTFLTRVENHSLKSFLEDSFKDQSTLLMPYDLYQYFKFLIGKDIGIGGTYKFQLMTEEALKKIQKTDETSKQIISLIALCSVIKNNHFTPLTEDFIVSCFNQSFSKENIKKSLNLLKDKKVIFYNKNTNQYLLQEGSPINIQEEIAKLKDNNLTGKKLVQVLKRYFKTDFIIPKKYNFNNAITRFYRTEIISVEELRNLKRKNPVNFYEEDGLVFYVVPFNYEELLYAKSEIQTLVSPLTVFIIPKQFIACRADIEELNAVDCLYHNKEIFSISPLVKKELDLHKDILLTSIHSLLKPLTGYMNLSVYGIYPRLYFLKGKKAHFKEISHFKELQRYLGDLFIKEYNKYIPCNLEYMNRHRVSGSITLARKKFIDALREYKKETSLDIRSFIQGQGSDYLILNTMLSLSHFKYNHENKIYEISKESKFYKFFKEFEKILLQHPQGLQGNHLLDLLVSPPYGFRLGVLPVFLALADLCFKHPVNHYFDSAYVKDLDGSHYDLLMKHPKKTKIHYNPISLKQQNFLKGLAQIFQSKDLSIRSVIEALIKWRQSIPESTKLSSRLSQESRKILIQVDSSKEPDTLLFNKIPECFNPTTLKQKNTKEILTKFKHTKKELDEFYKVMLLKMKEDLLSFIKFINKYCLNTHLKDIPKNKFIHVFQKSFSQIKDYPFSHTTSHFIGRVLNFKSSHYNQYFLETIGEVLTECSPRHWNDKGYSKFKFNLKKVGREIELACEIAKPQFKGQSVFAYLDKGEKKKTFIKLGAISSIEKTLRIPVEKIKTILNSFDEIDKKKIIMALLESIEKESIKQKDLNPIEVKNPLEIEINV